MHTGYKATYYTWQMLAYTNTGTNLGGTLPVKFSLGIARGAVGIGCTVARVYIPLPK